MLYRSSVRRRHFYARTTRLTSAAPGIVCRNATVRDNCFRISNNGHVTGPFNGNPSGRNGEYTARQVRETVCTRHRRSVYDNAPRSASTLCVYHVVVDLYDRRMGVTSGDDRRYPPSVRPSRWRGSRISIFRGGGGQTK